MDSAAYQNPTTNSYKNVWNNGEISVWDEKCQVLEWLSPLEPRERHRAVSEGRVDGVGDWLLRTKEFKKWHTGEDQAVHPVLFCYGDPGVGKTYLSSLVIDTLCDSIDGDNVAVACVYCDFHTHKEQSATGVLAALLRQLVAGVESVPGEITESFERAKREVGGRALRLREVRAMLVRSLLSLRRGFICVDALDEFPTKGRPELWDSLQHIVRECPNIRLFVTGRPRIREEIKKYFPGYPNLAPIRSTEQDIREYIILRLRKDPELDAMDAELEADILRIIPDKTPRVFLLVSLIMDAVLEDATIYQRRQTLHKMTNGLSLGDAYNATLSRIREQKGNRVKLGMEALMWVSCAKRPLKAEELCHALAVKVGATNLDAHHVPSIKTLLSCTLGLVTIDEQASTVRLVHFTLQEYLTEHPSFTTSHSMMAEICLTYLNLPSICELSTALDTVPPAAPFLHYASSYWGFHARKEMTEGVKRLALRLLQQDSNHIWAAILLHGQGVDFLSWLGHLNGRRPDLGGFTGLHCISYMGITEIATDMVGMKRWDMNGRDSNGATPLIWAAKYGSYRLAKLLLEQRDVNPILSDKQGLTPLIHAAKSGHEGVAKMLLERGDVNPNSSDKDGRTPLSYAAGSGHKGVVGVLLEREDVNPNAPDRYCRTPLSYAAGSGHGCAVRALLGREGVDPNSPDRYRRTPLSLAAGSGHEDVVKILLGREDVNPGSPDRYRRTPLSYAAGSGHGGVVKILLGRLDANPDWSNTHGRTALSYAAQFGHERVVKLLLERGVVKPDSSDEGDRSPLSYAAQSGHERVVRILLKRGDIDPDSSDEDGRTPLSFAAGTGHEGVVRILLERGDVNPDSSDWSGRTPLSHAVGFGHEGVVKILLERVDVNPDSLNQHGWTPLSYAAGSGYEGMVKMLLDRVNVNPYSSDVCGQALLSLASKLGRTRVVRLLSEPRAISHEASPNTDVMQHISTPTVGAPEGVELVPVPQREGIISGAGYGVAGVASLSRSCKPPSDRLKARPSSSLLLPTPSPEMIGPDPVPLEFSRPPKRYRATSPPLPHSKRKRFPSS